MAGLALGQTRARNAVNELKKALQRDSHREVIRIRALEGLAALEDERQLPLMLEMSRPGPHQRVRQSALRRAAQPSLAIGREQRPPVPAPPDDPLHDPLYCLPRGAF